MTEPCKIATGQLGRNSVAELPLTLEHVERIYKKAIQKSLEPRAEKILALVCESHERLRAENIGQKLMLADAEKRLAELETELRRVVSELTDPIGCPLDASEQADILRAAGLETPKS